MADDLANALASPDVADRIETIAELVRTPDASRPALVGLLCNPTPTPAVARVWAMIALCQIGDTSAEPVAHALIRCLSAPEPIVRRTAIETLGQLNASSAMEHIANHLADHQPIPEAWFDDSSTPAQAARRALQRIGTPAALELLRNASAT